MAIPTPGLAVQGLDINATIEKLVNVKREPLKRIESEVDELNLQKDIWETLRARLVKLGDLAKHLYDYTSPFGSLSVDSGDQNSFTATAERKAAEGERRIQVLQSAAAHRISSDSVRREKRLTGSVFTIEIGDKKANIDFTYGGTLADLAGLIEKGAKDLVRSSFAHDTLSTSVLVLEAATGGAGNTIRFGGDTKTLVEIGLLGADAADEYLVPLGSASAWTGYRGAQLDRAGWLVRDGVLELAPGKRFEHAFPKTFAASEGWNLSFALRFDTEGGAPAEQSPDAQKQEANVSIGPDDPLRIEDLSIRGNRLASGLDGEDANNPVARANEAARQAESARQNSGVSATNTRVLYLVEEDGQRSEFSVPVSYANGSWQEVSLPISSLPGLRSGSRLVLANDNTGAEVRFRDIRLGKGAADGLGVKNEMVAPRDAIFTIDGVRITRPDNTISDAIDGVTLKLIKEGPESALRVYHDSEMVSRSIFDFIELYNQTIVYINAISTPLSREEKEKFELEQKNKSELVRALEDKDKADQDRQRGKLVGDVTVTQLKSSMGTIIMSPYETRLKKDLALLIQAGISTGRSGANWDDLRRASGTLELDTAVLQSIIEKDVVALSELFGRDTTGDQAVDQGMAFKLYELLRTYTQPGNSGLIAVRTRTIDRNISDKRKSLERAELSIKSYEEQLRSQFSTMETKMREYQDKGRWLNRNDGNNK